MSALTRALSAARLNGLQLRNRILKAGCFEGMTPGGVPSDAYVAHHLGIARGGAAMTTLAYCASEPDGRLMADMMWMHEGLRPRLTALADAVHAEGAALSGQLGHCGHFTQNAAFEGKRPLGPSRHFNLSGVPYGLSFAGAMTEADMDALVDGFRRSAIFMKSVGFDAIELHFAHGYGLSQFISPKTNKRSDRYGGTLANRMRLPLRVLAAVREAVGDDFPVLGKMGQTDGVKGGLQLEEAIEVARMLDDGGIDCLIPSGGSSPYNPMLLFRGDNIWRPLMRHEPNLLLKAGIFAMKPFMFHDYPYTELYFLDGARRIRDACQRAAICYIGGATTPRSLEKVMDEFDFVQLGRPLIADPDMVKRLQAEGTAYRNPCTHCNECAALIKSPTGVRCVVTDPA